MRIGDILRLATNESNTEFTTRNENINALSVHLSKVLKFHHRLDRNNRQNQHRWLRCLNFKYSSHYVYAVYIICKVLFLLNVVLQLYLLYKFLFSSADISHFGVWRDIFSGNSTWRESGHFPRVIWCDFDVRDVGQSQNYSMQCVLSLNIFTEKVFLILSAWYLILFSITAINLIHWIYLIVDPNSSQRFISNHLEMSANWTSVGRSAEEIIELRLQMKKFVRKYLNTDGVFVLTLIAEHADVVFSTDLIYKIWEAHNTIDQQARAIGIENRANGHLRDGQALCLL